MIKSAPMHIDVSDILEHKIGATVLYDIQDERPQLEDLDLASGINGEISFIKADFGLVGRGQVATQIKLECHRCLRDYVHSLTAGLEAEFARQPADEQWPIAADGQLDLAPLVRQELMVHVPIQQVCEPDCPGLCSVCGQRNETGHQHTGGQTGQTIKERMKSQKGQ